VSVSTAGAETSVGRSVAELETPALTIDLDRLGANIARAADYAADHGLGLYPHAKTHKTLEIAALQRQAGARGLTVAKSREAEIYAEAGLGPILVHYPPVGPPKVERLVRVAAIAPLTLAVDSIEAAEPLAAGLRGAGVEAEALIEVDVGLHRTGLDPARAVDLARQIEGLGGGLRVAGLSCYPGHLRGPRDEVAPGVEAVSDLLGDAIARFDAAGIRRDRVSGGSTATLFLSHLTPMTELRPGNYALLDRAEAVDPFSVDDCALRVQATVVSRSVPGRAVLDCGSKTLSEAGPRAGLAGYGAAPARPELEIEALNEEHAICRVDAGSALTVGDRVEVIPNHACTCVNLHDSLWAVRGGVVEGEMRVVARGAVG
jgi:D-serine deaminase-like pyridoxal phosphate-dependent protein